MGRVPIPEADQMKAMLDGTIIDLLGQYFDNPRPADFRNLISVDRPKLISYLSEHPAVAEAYLQSKSANLATHDFEKIFQRGPGYVVVSMYRGEECIPRYFQSLAEAVAECVLLSHGMY